MHGSVPILSETGEVRDGAGRDHRLLIAGRPAGRPLPGRRRRLAAGMILLLDHSMQSLSLRSLIKFDRIGLASLQQHA